MKLRMAPRRFVHFFGNRQNNNDEPRRKPSDERTAVMRADRSNNNVQSSCHSIMPSATKSAVILLVVFALYTFLMLTASLDMIPLDLRQNTEQAMITIPRSRRLASLSSSLTNTSTEPYITTLRLNETVVRTDTTTTKGHLRQNIKINRSDAFLINNEETTDGFWNLTSPIWPYAPPVFRNDKCKVIFRNPNLRLCHVIPWGANFGDEIGPPVVKRILELYFRCSTSELPTFNLWEKMNTDGIMNRTQPCLMSVGSMFRMVRTGDHLWGTGVAYDHVVPHRCKTSQEPFGGQDLVTNLTVYSTRGPKSAGHMEQYCSFIKEPLESAGDGAVLIPFIFPEMFRFSTFDRMNNRKPYCVIPHHYERTHRGIKGTPTQHILSVQRTWENMTMELLKCDKVFSSSLHGVIMAEILGIPSRRLRMTNKPGDFKFADFYESYRGNEPLPWTTNVTQAMNMTVLPLALQERSLYAARVLKTFPIHLFTTVEE